MEPPGPRLASFSLDRERLNPLGPGVPDRSQEGRLAGLTPEAVVAPAPLIDRQMASACLAGLWLHYDFLDRSHEISQSIETAEGSYWHAIMHRREGDFDNAKYWFRRVGAHPTFAALVADAARLACEEQPDPAGRFLREQTAWDAYRFVDLCRACAAGRSTSERLCRLIQRREWQLLFDYCLAHARGEGG